MRPRLTAGDAAAAGVHVSPTQRANVSRGGFVLSLSSQRKRPDAATAAAAAAAAD